MKYIVIASGIEVATATQEGVIALIEGGVLNDGDVIKVVEE